MADVEWTLRAIADVQHISDYLARWSQGMAERRTAGITQAAESLADFPRLGRMIPAIDEDSFRQLVHRNYRIVYRVRGEQVRILAVLDRSMNLERALARRVDDF